MEKVMLLNGSPRAPKSNSKGYAELFSKACGLETEYFNITKNNHVELCEKINGFSHLVLVFPLYADGIPVTLLNFLKRLEQNPPQSKPVISVMVNCGFLEPHQNNIAVKMVRIFCRKNGYPFGSVLKIGSGEAILNSPFKIFVSSRIKKFARSIVHRAYEEFKVTMPISKKMFLNASTGYWINYAKKNGVTREEMDTMQIE